MKNIIKYILIFLGLVIVLTTLLVITALIPRSKIENNIQKSLEYLKSPTEVKEILPTRKYSYLHVYADEILCNIMYCVDSNKPLESVMIDKYYARIWNTTSLNTDLNYSTPSLKLAIENNGEGNIEYIRYWHGSMIFIRPLLTIMSITTIYKMNAIILSILLIILIFILIKKKAYILIFALIVGLIATASWYVPFCLEYYWTYLIMLITSIISIIIDKKYINIKESNKKLRVLYFITGILTCFFDFLTTELITVVVPVLIILVIRYKEKRINTIKDVLKNILIWLILWLLGYVCMWFAKWSLASVVLHENAFEYVIGKAKIRIQPQVSYLPASSVYYGAIMNNIAILYPSFLIKKNKIVSVAIVVAILVGVIILKKKFKESKFDYRFAIILLLMGLLPYVRYIAIANHSYKHAIFMFREQIITVMTIVLIIYVIIDKNKLKKQINIKRKKG